MTPRRAPGLVVVGFATLTYGLMALDWGFREIGQFATGAFNF